MKKAIGIILLFLTTNFVMAQCKLTKSDWELVFEEDFTKTNTSDYLSDWSFDTGAGNDCHNYPINKTDNAWVKLKEDRISYAPGADGLGELHFTAKKRNEPEACWNSNLADYDIGWMRSTYDDFPDHTIQPSTVPGEGIWCNKDGWESEGGILYGMFEIECKFPKTPGVNSSFWMSGNNNWPTEIDVMEYGHGNPNYALSSVYYVQNDEPGYPVTSCGNNFVYPYDLSDDFHTWSMVWTPTKITWFLDGKELKSDSDPSHLPNSGYGSGNRWGLCRDRKADMVISAHCSWDWGAAGEVSDALQVKSVKMYKPKDLLAWEDWLADRGQTKGTKADFNTYFLEEITPTYEQVDYKTEQDWNLFTVASFSAFDDAEVKEIDYECLSGLNPINEGQNFVYKGEGNRLTKTIVNNQGGYTSYSMSTSNLVDGDVEASRDGATIFYRRQNQLRYFQDGQFHTAVKPAPIIGVPCPNPESPWCLDDLPLTFKDNLLPKENGLQVYYRGLDNKVYTAWRNSLGTNLWNEVALTASGDCFGSLVADPTDDNILYYQTTSGHIRQLILSGVSVLASPIISSLNEVAGSLKVNYDGSKVFYRANGNRLCYLEPNGSSWIHNCVQAILPGETQLKVVSNVKSNINIQDYNDMIFYVGTDDRVWNVRAANGTTYNTSLDWKVDYIRNDLQFTTHSSGELACVGNDNVIRLWKWGECEILNLPCSGAGKNVYRQQEEEQTPTAPSIQQNRIYPNPNNSNWLGIDLMPAEKIEVNFYNLQGILVQQALFSAGGIQELDISDLSNGHYFVRISSPTYDETLKLIKL